MQTTPPLRDQVIQTILSKIQHHELTPGKIFTEQQICDELSISRTPVREALIQLAADHIITKIPRKGYQVTEIEDKTKLNTYVVLATLDALAATLAIDNLTEDDYLRMEEITDKLDIAIKYKNYSDYYMLQDEFHNIYLGKCENSTLIDMLSALQTGPLHRSYISDDVERLFKALHESNEEHRTIIRLFREKKAQELEAFLKNVHWATKYPDMI